MMRCVLRNASGAVAGRLAAVELSVLMVQLMHTSTFTIITLYLETALGSCVAASQKHRFRSLVEGPRRLSVGCHSLAAAVPQRKVAD